MNHARETSRMTNNETLQDLMTTVGSYDDGRLLAGRIDNIGVVLFNQPAKRNAVTMEMWDGVAEALDGFGMDDGIRVVVYAGAGGKSFVAGSDIGQFAARRGNADANAEFARLTGRGKRKVVDFAKPSIACIQGFCMGGGMALALQADLRVASGDSVFGIPAARLCISYGLEHTERLVALVGPGKARLMLYTARRFNAAEALSMGLVETVVPADEVVRHSVDLARTIADNAPLSVAAARYTVGEVLKDAAARDVAGVADFTRRCMESADYREGRTAFMEKRRPVFTGR